MRAQFSPLLAILATLLLASCAATSVSPEDAGKLLSECLQVLGLSDRCTIEDGSNREAFTRQRFHLVNKADPADAVVASYEFRSTDGEACVLVQLGRGSVSHVGTAEFFRCANRNKVRLGVG